MKPLSDLFLSLVRSIVPVLIFATVASGIASMGNIKRVGGVGLRALVYFEVVSTLALVIGMVVGNLVPAGSGLHIDPKTLDATSVASYVQNASGMTIVSFLSGMVPTNMVGDLARGEIMSVLVMAVLFGFALIHIGEKGARIAGLLDDFMHVVFGVVRMIMVLAPIAAFAAMAFTIGKFGFATILSLGTLLASVYLTSILFVLIVLGGVARMAEIRAVTNLFGNIFATVVIAKVMGELDEGLADKALHPGSMH